MTLCVLLLAAGRSSRMRGADKLMMPVGGQPCLRVMAQRILAANLPVIVTVPDLVHPRNSALERLDLVRVAVPDADQGMAHSISAGVAALPAGTQAVMVVPGDMPALETSDFEMLAEAHLSAPDFILRATDAGGKAGHPVIFPSAFFNNLSALMGDKGGQNLIRANPDRGRHIALPNARATTDLDTPEDWKIWNAKGS